MWDSFTKKFVYVNYEEKFSYKTQLVSSNVWEFFYSILFLLLVSRYRVPTHFIFVLRASSKLQTEFEKTKSLAIPSYMVEFRKLMGKYSLAVPNFFWLKNLFLVVLEQFENSIKEILKEMMDIRSKKKYWNVNLIGLISIIPNSLNRITVPTNTRRISHKSKEIYSFIIRRGCANIMLKAD